MKKLILQLNVKPELNEHQVTRTFIFDQDLYNLSFAQAKAYAEKYGADYKQITDCSFLPGMHPTYQRLKFFEMTDYDQVLMLDSDAIIMKDCPNIFELYKDSDFCSVEDLDWGSTSEYNKKIRQKFLKLYNASQDYKPFCAAITLMSKEFLIKGKELYKQYLHSYPIQYDQGILNRIVVDLGEKYTILPPDWGAHYRKGKFIVHLAAHKKKNFNLQKFCKINNLPIPKNI